MAIVTLVAGESLTVGDAVYVSVSGMAFRARASDETFASVAGVVTENVSVGSPCRLNVDSIVQVPTASYTPGESLYLSNSVSGYIDTYTAFASGLPAVTGSGAYLVRIGPAVTPSGISVELSKPVFVLK